MKIAKLLFISIILIINFPQKLVSNKTYNCHNGLCISLSASKYCYHKNEPIEITVKIYSTNNDPKMIFNMLIPDETIFFIIKDKYGKEVKFRGIHGAPGNCGLCHFSKFIKKKDFIKKALNINGNTLKYDLAKGRYKLYVAYQFYGKEAIIRHNKMRNIVVDETDINAIWEGEIISNTINIIMY